MTPAVTVNRLAASDSWLPAILRVIILCFIHIGIFTASRTVTGDTTMNETEKDHSENGREPAV